MSKPVIQPRRRFPAPGPLIAVVVLLLLLGGAAVYVSYYNRAIIAFPGNPVTEPEKPGAEEKPGLTDPPFWPEPPLIPRPEFVKGIYVNVQDQPLSGAFFTELIEFIQKTELNAVVIDLKDDRGRLTYNRTQVPWADSAGAPGQYIDDPVDLIARLSENGIYPIARIVAFKDALMVAHRPDLAALNNRGEPWHYYTDRWLDPYNKQSWKYVVALAREAAEMGFREIQLDYVRFPSDGNLNDINYPASDGTSFHEVIPAFLRYARASLAEYDVELSADIFGLVVYDPGDQGIGQHFESIAAAVDIVCPMIYPSHYGAGNLGLENPDAAPYDTVYRSLQVAVNRLEQAGLETTIRPWLQAFTINHLYGAAEVRAQIQAAEDLGIHEFLLWNNGNYYNAAALRPADK